MYYLYWWTASTTKGVLKIQRPLIASDEAKMRRRERSPVVRLPVRSRAKQR